MQEIMTSLERCRAVIEGRIPDRIPVCLLSFQNAAHFAGYSVSDYCIDARKLADAQLGYWEEFRHDMIEIENGVAALAEAVGCEVDYPELEPPWITKPAINSLDEIDRLPDDLLEAPGVRALIEATRLVAEAVGDEVCIRGDSDQGAFSLAAEIVGIENFLVTSADPAQAEKINQLLAYANEQVARLARAQQAAGSHYTVIGDSIAGPDVCSPRTYRTYAAPYEKALIERLRGEGMEVGLHICGNATRIINDMLATTCRYFELDYKVDREVVRAATDGQATIIGTVDPSNLIPLGTPAEVKAKAVEDIALLGQQGRFVLGAGCTLPRETPAENVHALVEAAHEAGWYGPDGRLLSDTQRGES